MLSLALAASAVGAWWWLDAQGDDRPPVTDVLGAHPGDLTPDLSVDDDVQNYGLPMSLPYHFTTTSEGFRATGVPPTPGALRILILGDSFAFGMGVGDADTFAARLAEALGPSVTVINAGVPGYTITDHLEQWRAKLAAYPADLILLCHTASDIPEMGRPTSLRRFLAWDDERPETDAEVAAVVARYGSKREAAEGEWMTPADRRLQRAGAAASKRFAEWQAAWALGAMTLAKEVRAAGRDLRLVLWVEGYGHFGATVEALVQEAARQGVPTFRGQAALVRGPVPADRLFLPDKHFSVEGNALAARQTAAWLTETGALRRR